MARHVLARFAGGERATRRETATLSPVGYRLRFIPLHAFGVRPPWIRGTSDGRWLLEQAFDVTGFVEHDRLSSRRARQARHGHDLTTDGNDETGTC